jgi:HD-like signal output (HDOD) protein
VLFRSSLKPHMIEKILKICNEKGISSDILENLTDGFNHSLIGSKLAEKWNFPASIVEAIKYHHSPYESADAYKDMIYIIYLANLIYYFKREEYSFSNINFEILKRFNLTDEKEFNKIFKTIFNKFDKKKENMDEDTIKIN